MDEEKLLWIKRSGYVLLFGACLLFVVNTCLMAKSLSYWPGYLPAAVCLCGFLLVENAAKRCTKDS
jgi:hypothetical protein